MKLYLDEDLSPAIARLLRERGVDAQSAHEVGMLGASDDEQLDYGAREGRAVVTRNARDFRLLAHQRVREQRPHAGIVVCSARIRGAEIRRIAEALEAVVRQRPEGLGVFDLLYLPPAETP